MIINYEIDENSNLIKQQIDEIESAAKLPIVTDEDCPEFSYEELCQMLAEKKAKERTKVVSIRLTEETINKAKLLGRGYTGIMSRVITYALDNPEILKKCL